MPDMSSNITKYYVYSFLFGLSFYAPIYIVFLLGQGLNFTQVMLLETIYNVIAVLLEVPSGYFADLKGRKVSLAVSAMSYVAAITVFLFGRSFAHFAISMSLWAAAIAFQSGADSALVYDSIKGKTKDFGRIFGKAGIIAMAASSIAMLIGGWLSGISLSWPFYATIISASAALFVVFLLREPTRKKLIIEKGHFHRMLEIGKFTFSHKKIICVTGIWIFLSPLMIVISYLIQPYIVLLGMPVSWLGAIYAFRMIVTAFGMFIGPQIDHKINIELQFFVFAVVSAVSVAVLATGHSAFSLVALIPVSVAFGAVHISSQNFINDQTASDKRATVLSFTNMMNKIFIAAFFAGSGLLLGAFSLRQFMLIASLVSVIGCTIFVLLLTKTKVKKPIGRSLE